MARWTAGAKWGEAPAPDGQRDTPLSLSLSEWLGRTAPMHWLATMNEDNIEQNHKDELQDELQYQKSPMDRH